MRVCEKERERENDWDILILVLRYIMRLYDDGDDDNKIKKKQHKAADTYTLYIRFLILSVAVYIWNETVLYVIICIYT